MATHSGFGLENSMDRGAWQATDHGVTQSCTRLTLSVSLGTLEVLMCTAWPWHLTPWPGMGTCTGIGLPSLPPRCGGSLHQVSK